MEAGNSVIECALMGIQQTHKPNKVRRGFLKQARQSGIAATVLPSALSPITCGSPRLWTAGLPGVSNRTRGSCGSNSRRSVGVWH